MTAVTPPPSCPTSLCPAVQVQEADVPKALDRRNTLRLRDITTRPHPVQCPPIPTTTGTLTPLPLPELSLSHHLSLLFQDTAQVLPPPGSLRGWIRCFPRAALAPALPLFNYVPLGPETLDVAGTLMYVSWGPQHPPRARPVGGAVAREALVMNE